MKGKWLGRWAGRTVVCIASGPSLTAEDCEAVHRSGHPAIVTNTTFRLCPWAEVLFGFDGKWWKTYMAEVRQGFAGELLTCSSIGHVLGVPSMHQQSAWFRPFGNSGTAAVSLAIVGKAARVVLLGYDCQAQDGRIHWHGDHPRNLGNASSIKRWPFQFKQLAKHASKEGVEVLNASRSTVLTCFARAALDEAL